MLCDYGLCASLESQSALRGKVGTRGWWAPETILKQPQSCSADWWAVGVLAAYCATGRHPFHPPVTLLEGGLERTGGAGACPSACAAPHASEPAEQPAPAALAWQAELTGSVERSNGSPSSVVAGSGALNGVVATDAVAPRAALEVLSGAEAQAQARKKAKEVEMNEATLHRQLEWDEELLGRDLAGFVAALLTRDAEARLGCAGATQARPPAPAHCPTCPHSCVLTVAPRLGPLQQRTAG